GEPATGEGSGDQRAELQRSQVAEREMAILFHIAEHLPIILDTTNRSTMSGAMSPAGADEDAHLVRAGLQSRSQILEVVQAQPSGGPRDGERGDDPPVRVADARCGRGDPLLPLPDRCGPVLVTDALELAVELRRPA